MVVLFALSLPNKTNIDNLRNGHALVGACPFLLERVNAQICSKFRGFSSVRCFSFIPVDFHPRLRILMSTYPSINQPTLKIYRKKI